MKNKVERIHKNFVGLALLIWPIVVFSFAAIYFMATILKKWFGQFDFVVIIVYLLILFFNVIYFFFFSKRTIIFFNKEKLWTKVKGKYCEWLWADISKCYQDVRRFLPKWLGVASTRLTEVDKLCWLLVLETDRCKHACKIPIYMVRSYEKIKRMCPDENLIKQMDEVLKDIWEE